MTDIMTLETGREMLAASLTALLERFTLFLPSLVAALLILAIGWVVSRVVQAVAARALARVGLDRAAERVRVAQALRDGGVTGRSSELLALLLFWVLMLTFVVSAVETLGLTAATATIDRLVAYLPSVIAAALIFLLGALFGRLARNVVASGAAASNVAYAQRLGGAANAAVVVTAGVLALEQLGVDTGFLVTLVTALVATTSLAFGIAFSLGAREVVSHILAGHYLRQSLPAGRQAEVEGRAGVVERVGPVSTTFRGSERTWTVPNGRLLREIVLH